MQEKKPILREDEDGFLVGANVLDHAMGMTTEGLGLKLETEVIPSDDDDEEEYINQIIEDSIDIDDDAIDISNYKL